MGSTLCKPRQKKRITTSSWVANENENPFELSFTKKERMCLRETYQKLSDPKEIIGLIYVDIVNDIATELKPVFGVDRAPKVSMLKLPKFGGHVSRTVDFLEQMTLMLGFTENLVGAWQLVRKTGRLHAKVPFLEENQNQLEKNYFAVVCDAFTDQFIQYLTGDLTLPTVDAEAEKKKVRFAQNYTKQQIVEVWKRFFTVMCGQLTESFEFERQKCLNAENQRTLAPHQKAEEAQRKKRQNAEKQSEGETATTITNGRDTEEMFEDPF